MADQTYDLAAPPDANGQFDIDEFGRLVYGVDALVQNLLHRVVTPTGAMIDAPAWGDDIRSEVNEADPDPAAIGARVKAQWLADERVFDCDVAVTTDPEAGTIDIVGEGESEEGAFSIDYTVTAFPSADP